MASSKSRSGLVNQKIENDMPEARPGGGTKHQKLFGRSDRRSSSQYGSKPRLTAAHVKSAKCALIHRASSSLSGRQQMASSPLRLSSREVSKWHHSHFQK